jgi:hypothetical protein
MQNSIISKLDVLSVFITWVLLLVFFGVLAYGKIFSEQESSANHLIYIFATFLVFGGCHVVLALFNRCPHCNKCLTIQGVKPPHAASTGSWNKVVWRWFSGTIVCIHCGQKVLTSD